MRLLAGLLRPGHRLNDQKRTLVGWVAVVVVTVLLVVGWKQLSQAAWADATRIGQDLVETGQWEAGEQIPPCSPEDIDALITLRARPGADGAAVTDYLEQRGWRINSARLSDDSDRPFARSPAGFNRAWISEVNGVVELEIETRELCAPTWEGPR